MREGGKGSKAEDEKERDKRIKASLRGEDSKWDAARLKSTGRNREREAEKDGEKEGKD